MPAKDEFSPTETWHARHRGNIALGVSIVGFIAALWASQGVLPYWPALLLQAFFEGALVGSLADWFAVTAIFHRVPIPLLARHTHILARKRASMTEGIVDMVQNHWLSPAALRDWLKKVSFADLLTQHLLSPEGLPRLQAGTLQGIHLAARYLMHPSITLVICRFWQRTLQHCPLPTTLTPWLLKLLRRRETETQLYRQLATGVAWLRQQPQLMDAIGTLLVTQLDTAKSDSAWARARLWIGKQFLKGDSDSDKLQHVVSKALAGVQQQLSAMANDCAHPLRRAIRRQLFVMLRQADHDGRSAVLIDRISQRLLPLLTQADSAEAIARRIQQELSSLLFYDTHLQRAVQSLVEHQIRRLIATSPQRERLDSYLRHSCLALFERYPNVIGNIVRESLSPERMPTESLVRQIESKVGQEMQWIRVNGAVVGGLVAMLLALVRQLSNAIL